MHLSTQMRIRGRGRAAFLDIEKGLDLPLTSAAGSQGGITKTEAPVPLRQTSSALSTIGRVSSP